MSAKIEYKNAVYSRRVPCVFLSNNAVFLFRFQVYSRLMRFFFVTALLLAFLALAACFREKPVPEAPLPAEELPDLAETLERLGAAGNSGESDVPDAQGDFPAKIEAALRNAEIPEAMSRRIRESITGSPAFILDLLNCLQGDSEIWRLVDKGHELPPDYEPADLAELGNGDYTTGRAGLRLRLAAADSLAEMAAAAKEEGVTLVVSSAYRSYRYQVEVYNRIVRELGQEAADRESARPGYSQHQTGLTVDFGSIDDSFAQTAAGRWMAANASRFGWSLSFPQGYEAVTGYRWESWHYRYVGKDLAAFIDNYFEGIQQYALRFIYEWENLPFSAYSGISNIPSRMCLG
jgi:D-alanyl-D-alanine carboxypeptidase